MNLKNPLKKSVEFGAVLLMVLLMLSTAVVPAAFASEATGGTGAVPQDSGSSVEGGCSGCCGGSATITVVELEGSEKNKAIAMALANDDVKKLRQERLDQGYTPKVNEAKAALVQAVLNDSEIELVGVRIPFESKEINKTQEIIFAYNPDTGEVAAIIAESPWDCVTCTVAILGCGVCIASCVVINAACITCLLLSCVWVAPLLAVHV